MDEATKTKLFYPDLFSKYITGKTLDIGAGDDPVAPDATVFDKAQGNAERIYDHFHKESFDSVFSSHCLEHVNDPTTVIKDWFGLVKPGGHLFVIVPDEDLYEQGHFPSIFNEDHKSTFTISKSISWSSASLNLYEIAQDMGGVVVYLKQQSNNYDLSLWSFRRLGIRRYKIGRHALRFSVFRNFLRSMRLIAIDQTSFGMPVLAQICIIIRKENS